MSALTPDPNDEETVVQYLAEDETIDPCLGDDTLGLMIDGEIESDARARVESHVDRCCTCRAVLATMVELRSPNETSPSTPFQPEAYEPGHAIDHYTVSELIGRGGMGAVYLARDSVLERDVAIKVVGARVLNTRSAREALMKEARATARLNHPNIVTIHAVGEVDELPYLALEHVKGSRLRDWLSDGGANIDEGLVLFEAIAEALVEAHRCGILHRDLKPENVLIREDGRVKVLDFGLAREISVGIEDAESAAPLRTAVAGTPRYMAPEQWDGEHLTKGVDVFALGVMLFELVSGGNHPFGASRGRQLDSAALAKRVRSGDPADKLTPAKPVSKALADMIARCLEMDAHERPDAAGVLDVLRRHQPSQRRIGWVAAVGAVAALAIGVAAVAIGQSPQPATLAPAAPRSVSEPPVVPPDRMSEAAPRRLPVSTATATAAAATPPANTAQPASRDSGAVPQPRKKKPAARVVEDPPSDKADKPRDLYREW